MAFDLERAKRDCGTVEVEPWGEVKVKALSARAIQTLAKKYGNGQLTNDDAFKYYVELIADSIVDDKGDRVLVTEQDRESLADSSFRAIQRLGNAILEFNGLNEDAEKN